MSDDDNRDDKDRERRADVQRLPSGSYRTQVRDPLNPTKRISFVGSRAQVGHKAERIRSIRGDVRHGTLDPEDASRELRRQTEGVVSVAEAWRAYRPTLRGKWEKQAQSTYTHRLAPTFGALRCAEITESTMRTWEAGQLADGWAPKTVSNAAQLLRGILNLQIRDGRLRGLPWGSYKPAKAEPRREAEACRSIEELEAIVMAARRRDAEIRAGGKFADLAFRLLVAALMGLRQGELAGLGWGDVEIDVPIPIASIRRQATDGWRVRHPEWTEPQDPVKGRQAKVQRLHLSAVAALRAQRENLEAAGLYKPRGPVFPGRGGAWRTHADTIDADTFREVVASAGLPNPERWSPHALRHTFAVLELVASGGDLKATQERMRHSSVRILEGYMHKLGRGLAESKIPELPPGVLPEPPPRQLPPHEPAPEMRPFAVARDEAERLKDVVTATSEAAHAAEAERREEKRENRKRSRRAHLGKTLADFTSALRAWDAAGRKGDRPAEVTAHAERARQRARASYLRTHDGEERAANARGQSAFRGVIASWGAFLKRKEKGK